MTGAPAADGRDPRRAGFAAWGATILRLAVGTVFLAHGIQKASAWGLAGGVPFFRQAGIPIPELAAPLVAAIELGGGVALLLGYGTRVAAALLAAVMAVALVAVHAPHGFFLPNGYEFVLTLGAACLALALTGPGRLALGGSG